MNEKIYNDFGKYDNAKARSLHQALRRNGVDFATGVPCGVLNHVIQNLVGDPAILHLPANRESEAVGIAVGAYLAGRKPILYMQNSGFFAASNDVASLMIPYQIPVLFIVSYRGCEGEDAVQHQATGKATEQLIKAFELCYTVYDNQDFNVLIDGLFEKALLTKKPVVLLLKRGWQK